MEVLIDSRDRLSSSTSSADFQFRLPNAINNIRSVELKQGAIPNTIYNVRSSNNMIKFTRSSILYTAIITPKAYNVTDLATAIAAAMNALDSNTYTCTYDSSTMKLTIAGTGAFVINFGSSTLWREIGWNNIDTTSATSQVAPNVVNLSVSMIYIVISKLSSNQQITTNQEGFTFTVMNNVDNGAIIYYEPNSPRVIKVNNLSLAEYISVKLATRNETLDLNGADWQCLLRFDV